jgi:D-3-phosphoglycerate dehydrogenase / 2-oxoglutarate reductase
MLKILANDGIDAAGKQMLEASGFEVDTNKIPQNELPGKLAAYDVLIVRSATRVDASVIDAGTNLKLIARAGVGLDNIDVRHAGQKQIGVVNTPAASSPFCSRTGLRASLQCLPFSLRDQPHHANGRQGALQ